MDCYATDKSQLITVSAEPDLKLQIKSCRYSIIVLKPLVGFEPQYIIVEL